MIFHGRKRKGLLLAYLKFKTAVPSSAAVYVHTVQYTVECRGSIHYTATGKVILKQTIVRNKAKVRDLYGNSTRATLYFLLITAQRRAATYFYSETKRLLIVFVVSVMVAM